MGDNRMGSFWAPRISQVPVALEIRGARRAQHGGEAQPMRPDSFALRSPLARPLAKGQPRISRFEIRAAPLPTDFTALVT